MNRRQTLALAFAGLAASPGCKSRKRDGEGREEAGAVEPGAPGGGSRELEGQTLVPAQVDPGLEIRTAAGLRPFRPSGFVLRREEREGKILVHNYGHGGGGISLSWGCAHLALELAGPVAGKSCAVIGGGVMGLSTALLLRRRGAEVTLYSRELPPETTSNLAGAQWWPVSVFDAHLRTEAFAAQFVAAANISHRAFQDLVGARWGVRWVPNYYLSNDEPANGWMGGPGGVLHHLQVGFRDFGPGEHIFPARFVRRFHSMLIEPAAYLATLLRDVQIAGARIEIRHFASAQEALRLPQALLFNCSGLGARELFGDEQLIPVKGQLTVLLPQPEVRYNLISNHYYMFPRSDGIVLGGTYERGQSDTTPDPAARLRILDAHRTLFDGMAQYQGVSR